MYGPHLIFEGYDSPTKLLGDRNLIRDFLDNLPAKIDMTKIIQPHILQYSAAPDPRWGVSGFVIIAESHIAIHTYPETNFCVIDVFSCKYFNESKVVELICEELEISDCEYHTFKRGAHYPTDVSETSRILEIERGSIAVKTI